MLLLPPSPARRGLVRSLALLLAGFVGAQSAYASPQGQCMWAGASPSPVNRFEAAVTAWLGQVYVFGGFDSVGLTATMRCDRYDPATDLWTRIADMPEPVTHANAVRYGTRVFFVGGFVGTNPAPVTDKMYVYNLLSDTWTSAAWPVLPEKRGGGALIELNGRLHYIGGYLEDRITSAADHWVLDMSQPGEVWNTTDYAPLPLARGHFAAIEVGGLIYVIGGQVGHDPFVNPNPPWNMVWPADQDRVEVYDLATNTWTQLASLPFPRSHFEGGTYVHHGDIVIAGGRSSSLYADALDELTSYSIAADSWSELAPLPEPLLAPVVQPIGATLVLTTGGAVPETPQATTWTRDLNLGQPAEVRVNAGGPALSLDDDWCPDSFANGGQPLSVGWFEVAGTNQDGLYVSAREGTGATPAAFSYALPAPNGAWRVVLHFAEFVWTQPGQRVFDVRVEGALVLDDWDQVAQAGASMSALSRSFDVLVEDGVLDVQLDASVHRPQLNGIELLRLEDGTLEQTCAGLPNSVGPGAQLLLVGSTSLAEAALEARVSGQPSGAPGAFLLAAQPGGLPFGSGILCVDPFGFLAAPIQFADGLGDTSVTLPVASPAFAVGQSWHLQLAYLDLAAGELNTSSALSFTFTP